MACFLPIRRHPLASLVGVRLLANLLATGFAVGLMEGPDCLAALLHAVHERRPTAFGPGKNLPGVVRRPSGTPRPATQDFSTGEFS